MFYRKLYKESLVQNVKTYCTKVRPQIELNEEVGKSINEGLYKPRKHPGIFKPKTINLPEQFIKAAEKALQDYPAKQLLESSKKLISHIFGRHPPIEENEFNQKKMELYGKLQTKFINPDNPPTEEEIEIIESKMKKIFIKKLKQNVYHWEPIQYDVYKSLEYLLGRSAAEYAVLVRTFQEISNRDPEFKPRTFFDFGSGVGIGTWAAKYFWQKYLFEYFNVDVSADMNDLALILLKGGTGLGEPSIKGVYHRQFLPATNTSYDLVMSSYTLLELPSTQARLETILNLWNKTEKYLVLTEVGTNAGFKLICEARDFILDIKEGRNQGHVFAPCSHEMSCPRYLTDTTPCNFEIQYNKIPIGQNSEIRTERYCYIILKKGKPSENDERWPRIVRPTLVRSKHAICRMCTANGKLEEVIFTKSKHGETVYRCAKASEWGDLLPIKILPKK